MSIMIDVPPAVVHEVRLYAEARGMTLNTFLRGYMTELAGKKGTARLMGAASRYANCSRRSLEKTAFRRAMEVRHAKVR